MSICERLIKWMSLLMLAQYVRTATNTAHTPCTASYNARGDGTCYKVYKVNATRNQAQILCANERGHLAGIRSTNDNILYNDVIKDAGLHRAWLGMTRETPPHPVWRYTIDGSEQINQGCYRHNPDDTDFYYDSRYTMLNATTPETCINFCRDNFTEGAFQYAGLTDGRRCACAVEGFTKEKPFNSAVKHPDEKGCTRECSGTHNKGNTVEKSYCGGAGFMTILKISATVPTRWAFNQPNGYNLAADEGYQSCATLDTRQGKNKYNDEMCNLRLPYICQGPDRHFVLGTTQSDWFSARADCLENGADLAKPENESDIEFLLNNIISPENMYWVGLTSLKWTWQFGDELRFAAWSPGEPNDVDNTCGYVDVDGDGWYDAPCEGKYLEGYICELYNPPLTTTAATTSVTPHPGQSVTPSTGVHTKPRTTAAWTTTRTPRQTQWLTSLSSLMISASTAAPPSAGPTAGASTAIAGFSLVEFVLTVLFAFLALIVIVLITVVACTKRKNNRKNRINVNKGGLHAYNGYNGTGCDARGMAALPYGGYLREEVYIPASEFGSTGSQADLLKAAEIPERPRCAPSPGPDRKIQMDEGPDDTLKCQH